MESIDRNKIFKTSFNVEARPGQILIFHSYLEHMVKPSSNTATYAGNILVTKTGETYPKIKKASDEVSPEEL